MFHPERTSAHGLRACLAALALVALSGCTTVIKSATNGMAANLNSAMLNQDDPELVRDGAPAYLLMLDSLVEGAPEDVAMLGAAAQLYAAYGVVFVDDAERARTLTRRARNYGERALCSQSETMCGAWNARFPDFEARLQELGSNDAPALYALAISWLAWIRSHSDDWSALADLPKVEAAFKRVQALRLQYQRSSVEHMLAVLNTIRPPALGGDFETGWAHYQRAIKLSGGRDLGVKVDLARYYARTLFDRDLHDETLRGVLEADPVAPGLTLFNTIAQRQARDLLATADDYF
jgi:hypothetical protein